MKILFALLLFLSPINETPGTAANESAKKLSEESPLEECDLSAFSPRSFCFGVDWKNPNAATVEKISPMLKDANGLTPLHFAAFFNDTTAIALLIKNGADINAKREHLGGVLQTAVIGARNRCCGGGWLDFINTFLFDRADGRAAETVALLIKNGADVGAANHFGATPLHHSALNGFTKIAVLLIENGAEVNAENDESRRPLFFATLFFSPRIMYSLKKHGADYSEKTKQGFRRNFRKWWLS